MTAAPSTVKPSRIPGEDDGEKRRPFFESVTDFFARCGTKIDFLVEPHLPRGGFVLVIAAPKGGKTFYASWLGAKVAAEVGSVLFVEEEGPAEVLRERLAPFVGQDPSAYKDRLHVAHRRGFRLDDRRWVDALIAEARAKQAVLIVLDPCVQLHGLDENGSTGDGMATVARAIQRIIAATGATVLLVHHTRKGGSWDKGDESEAQSSDARGSGALVGAADSIISIKAVPRAERQPGEVRFWVENTDTRVGAPFDKRLAIVNLTGGPEAMTFLDPAARTDAEIKRLLPFIPFAPEVITVDDLRDLAGGSAEKVRSAIKSGVGDGIISRRSGKGGGVFRAKNHRLVGNESAQSETITDDRLDSIGESATVGDGAEGSANA